MVVSLRLPSEPSHSERVPSTPPMLAEFQHCSPFPVLRNKHKPSKDATGRGISPVPKSTKQGAKGSSRVKSKLKHSSYQSLSKMASLTPVLGQTPSSPGPEVMPSTSTILSSSLAQQSKAILVLYTQETYMVVRELLSL